MKTFLYTTIFCLFCIISMELQAQEVTPSLAEAKSSYSAGNLDDARFALEQAIHQIDQAIGREILKILPTSLSGMEYHEQEDNVVGNNLGFAGLFVDRNYGNGEQTASIEIIGDSPLMAGLNAMLALPAVMTNSGDGDQKRIKVDGYKSLMQKDTNSEGVVSYTIQIPANTTLISLNCLGFDENQVIAMANTIPVAQIIKLAQ